MSNCIEKIRKILCNDVTVFDLEAIYLKVTPRVTHCYGKLHVHYTYWDLNKVRMWF